MQPFLRRPHRSASMRALARVLVLALVTSLLPVPYAHASLPSVEHLAAAAALTSGPGTSPATSAYLQAEDLETVIVFVLMAEANQHGARVPVAIAVWGVCSLGEGPGLANKYNRARWMDPHTGRFVGMDSFAGRLTDPATLHRYVYASADPSNMKDPTGQFFEASFSIGLSFTLSGMSVPSLKAMLSRAAVLELPIVTVIDSLANVDTGALEARIQEYLAQAASIWSRLNITVVPGPRTPPLYMKNADIESSQDYYRRVRDAGLIMWHTNSVPVVFLAGAHVFDHGGLKNGGFAAPKTALKHPGVIGISDGAYPTTLAHEVGHALGLDDRSDDPSLLMFERVAGGTLHTAQEAITATGFFFARNGVGKP